MRLPAPTRIYIMLTFLSPLNCAVKTAHNVHCFLLKTEQTECAHKWVMLRQNEWHCLRQTLLKQTHSLQSSNWLKLPAKSDQLKETLIGKDKSRQKGILLAVKPSNSQLNHSKWVKNCSKNVKVKEEEEDVPWPNIDNRCNLSVNWNVVYLSQPI